MSAIPPPAPRRPAAGLVALAGLLAAVALTMGVVLARPEPTNPPSVTPSHTPVASDEPVVQVARIVLPSTVRIQVGQASGSGVIYRSDGYVLTAAHVVGTATELDVRLPDGARIKGHVRGRDPRRDVAVVKVDRKGLKAAALARGDDIHVGQLAVALGSPFGLVDTVTAGVVSGVGRTFPTTEGVVDAIQTDAPVNPGNSGGPLADRRGRIIGINFAARGQGASTIGFAIPIDVAIDAARYLARGETPPPIAYMGVSGIDGADGRAGGLLTNVEEDGPGYSAGLREGDLVIAIDREALESMSQLAVAIRRHTPGDRVRLRVLRGRKTLTIRVTLAARP